MAFYIETDMRRRDSWHVNSGNRKPELMAVDQGRTMLRERVTTLQADGDELDLIRTQFEGIPITKGYLCVWRGYLAQFIFENLY